MSSSRAALQSPASATRRAAQILARDQICVRGTDFVCYLLARACRIYLLSAPRKKQRAGANRKKDGSAPQPFPTAFLQSKFLG